jgi:hypothetical protein
MVKVVRSTNLLQALSAFSTIIYLHTVSQRSVGPRTFSTNLFYTSMLTALYCTVREFA